MSAAERLRKAAEKVLRDSTFLEESDFPELRNERRQRECVADLLRSVAHDIEEWRDRLEHWPEPITLGPPTRAWDAAAALADAILGDAVPLDDDCPPVGDVDPAQVAASLRDIAAATPACPSCDGTGHVEWPGVTTVSFTEAYATTTTAAWTPCPSCDGTGKETS